MNKLHILLPTWEELQSFALLPARCCCQWRRTRWQWIRLCPLQKHSMASDLITIWSSPRIYSILMDCHLKNSFVDLYALSTFPTPTTLRTLLIFLLRHDDALNLVLLQRLARFKSIRTNHLFKITCSEELLEICCWSRPRHTNTHGRGVPPASGSTQRLGANDQILK